jgi:hypothetical protein
MTGAGWRLHDVRWTPGQGCHFTYRVEIAPAPPRFVSMQVTSSGWTTQDYLEDHMLPGLPRATDPALVTARLSRVCGGPVSGSTIEAVRYRPGSRCVLRYVVDAGDRHVTLFAKAFQPEKFAQIAPAAVALAGAPAVDGLVAPLGGGARVHEPLAIEAGGVDRVVAVPEDDDVGAREAPAHAREAAGRRAGVVQHRDPRAVGLDDPGGRQAHQHLGLVDVAVDRGDRRAERLDLLERPDRRYVAGVQNEIGAPEAPHALGRESPVPARQVRVGDDRHVHPPTIASPRP